jgi:hypothetical protein
MKTHYRISAPVLWTSLAAFALATGACDRNNRETASAQTTRSTAAAVASTAAAKTQPVSLTGCLQEGNRGTYILTELNRPKQPDSSNPTVIAGDKLAAAEEAYVLSSKTETDMSKLVGNRVHVEGTLARASDLSSKQPNADRKSVGTAGQSGELTAIESGHAIKEHDLAKVDVTSIQKVANACGSHAADASPQSK